MNRQNNWRGGLVLVLLLGSFLVRGAWAQSAPSMLRSDGFRIKAALHRAALKLFPPKRGGTIYDIRMKERVELHSKGIEYETYTIEWNLQPVGTFTRIKLVFDTDTHLDFAVRLDGGRIIQAMPMRVVFLDRHPVLGVEKLFSPFEGLRSGTFGEAMGALCDSLLYLERIEEGSVEAPKMTDSEFEKLSKALYASLPKPGPTLPAFELTSVQGRKLSASLFGKKVLLAFFGTVTDEADREMIETLRAFAAENASRCSFVFFLGDRPEYLERYLARAKPLPGHVVLDFSEETKKLFQIPTTPHLVGYQNGQLRLSTLHSGPADTARALSRFRARSLGAPWRSRSLPRSFRDGKPSPEELARLQIVARCLFPLASEKRLPRVELRGSQSVFSKGLAFRHYQVFEGAADRGQFVRVGAEFGKGQTIDCAFRLHRGCIQGARLVTPLKVGKVEVDDLSEVFEPFRRIRAERYGPALATLFRGVAALDRVDGGIEKGDAGSYTDAEIVNVVKVEQPKPLLGDALPTFALKDMSGSAFTGARLAGRPALLVLGKVKDAITLEMRVEIDRFYRVHRKKVELVEIFEDPRYILQDALDHGLTPGGLLVHDEAEAARTLLKAPYVPYLFAYGSRGRLVAFGPYRGKMHTRGFLADFAKNHLKK